MNNDQYKTYHSVEYSGVKYIITVDKEAEIDVKDFALLFDGKTIFECKNENDKHNLSVNGLNWDKKAKKIIFSTPPLPNVEQHPCLPGEEEIKSKILSFMTSDEREQFEDSSFINDMLLLVNQSREGTFMEEQVRQILIRYDDESENARQKGVPATVYDWIENKLTFIIQSLQPDWQYLPVVEFVGLTSERVIKTDANGKAQWEWKNINVK